MFNLAECVRDQLV